MSEKEPTRTLIDASGLILGRMSSIVAKRLLAGESIVIINAEKAVISGKRLSRVNDARAFLKKGHFRKGPSHPRRPDQIIRRAIRGMLPRRLPKGQIAFRRLKVFIGVPYEFKDNPFHSIAEAGINRLRCPYVLVGEYAKEIGYSAVGE